MKLPQHLRTKRPPLPHTMRPHFPVRNVAPRIPPPPLDFGPNVNGEAPYPFQCDGMRWWRERMRGLLADEMGLGKTIIAIRATTLPAIVVCPASLRLQWQDLVNVWRPTALATVQKPGSLRKPYAHEFLITSYEGLPEPAENATRWLIPDHLASDTTLILDEAQYAKHWRAKRTQKVRLLGRQCRSVYALTGTPLDGHPLDLWGVLMACGLATHTFGSFASFVELFGGKREKAFKVRRRNGTTELVSPIEFEGAKPEVPELLRKVMLRRLRADVLPELPQKTYSTLMVETPEVLIPELNMIDAAWRQLGTDELPPFQMMSTVLREMAEARIPDLMAFVERYEDARIPLVVFCSHLAPLNALAKREGWGIVTGEMAPDHKRTVIQLFQSGLLGGIGVSTGAAGFGITLTRASHALFVDRPYNPHKVKQAEDRLPRIGQKADKVHITYMVANHAVDRRLHEILVTKQRHADLALGEADE